jgi:undecaprenyl-diphosphatase
VELLKAIILGVIQGATEFLPVSSSGHLVLGSHLLDFRAQGIVFDVMLHIGTLLSVLVVFRKELIEMARAPVRWLGGWSSESQRMYLLWDVYVVVATIPAVIVGLFFKDNIELLFTSEFLVCLMLIVTGLMMIASRHLNDRGNRINGARSFLIGCGQALAIVPGISRSGTTIFVGMLLGVNRETVAKFSFIMSIPAILGAAVLNLGDVVRNPPSPDETAVLISGTLASALTGYLAIKLLLDIIRRNRLQWFGYYCLAVAAAGLIYFASAL